MSAREYILSGDHPELGTAYAAVAPDSRFVEPAVRSSRLGALLAPYRDDCAARAALEAAGCLPDTIRLYDAAR